MCLKVILASSLLVCLLAICFLLWSPLKDNETPCLLEDSNHTLADMPEALAMAGGENQVEKKAFLARQGRCFALFNEIGFQDKERKFFIELRRVCETRHGGLQRRKPMRNYKLGVITDEPLRISLVTDLGYDDLGFRDEDSFYLLQPSASPNDVNAFSKITQAVPTIEDFNFATSTVYAFILFYADNVDVFRKFHLWRNPNRNFEYGLITNNVHRYEELIATNIVDLVLACRGSSCPVVSSGLSRLIDSINSKQDVKISHTPVSVPDAVSLNRCSGQISFSHSTFQLGPPTPGVDNDCSNYPVVDCASIAQGEGPYSTDNNRVTFEITSSTYTDLMKCDLKSIFSIKNPDDDFNFPLMNRITKPQQIKSLEIPITAYYLDSCKPTLPNNGWILNREWIRSWLSSIEVDGKCVLSCSFCKKFFELGFRSDVRYKDQLQNAGYMGYTAKSSTGVNEKYVLEHAQKPTHVLAATFFKHVSSAGANTAVEAYTKAENVLLQPTIRVVYMVYAEVRAGSSFNSHSIFVGALKRMGVFIGNHQQSSVAAYEITDSIAVSMQEIFITRLLEKRPYFSLIVDASTDNSNKPILICLFQVFGLEKMPKVYFYALLHLENGESATAMASTFSARLQKDDSLYPGFSEFFKSRLVSIASDNANVMVGREHSFFTEIQKYTGTTIQSIGCLAHKVELIIERALKDKNKPEFSYYSKFDNQCNKFYTFYMSYGSKRYQHLADTAEENDFDIVRLKKHFAIRWAASYYTVIDAIKTNFEAMKEDLFAMAYDTTLSDTTRDGAVDLLDVVGDKSFVIVLHEFADLLTVFKKLSLNFQKSGGNLVGKYKLVQEALTSFDALKSQPGENLKAFLTTCVCNKKCKLGTCTLEKIQGCSAPNCAGNVYTDITSFPAKHAEARKSMYEAFADKMRSYFDLKFLKAFEMFQPELYNVENGKTILSLNDFDTRENLKRLCAFAFFSEIECKSLTEDLPVILKDIFSDTNSKNLKLTDILILVLNKATSIPSPTVSDLIARVLVTPFGSADAERGFSFVTNTKRKERSRMKPETVESIVRLKMNGPLVDKFDSPFYTRKYLKNHMRSDDQSLNSGALGMDNVEKDQDPDSIF